MGSADRWPDLTGKTWAHKTATEMTDDEVNDARATFAAVGRNDCMSEWLRRHGLPENYGDPKPAPAPWPAGVTARFLTRIGLRHGDARATVDITDTSTRSTATCRPCGWTHDHGINYRASVLTAAQQHADDCTALPNPNSGEE